MDNSIILRTRQGDIAAFTELYGLTHDRAYSVAYSILKDDFEAEDIVQEAYIIVMEKLDDLKNPDRFESWFYQIVRSRALNDLKKKRPTTFTSLDSPTDPEIRFVDTLEADPAVSNGEAIADEAETRRLVRDMVMSLPEMQKKCILMRYQGDMKICDIAKALNIPESTVKSNLNYGKKKIEDSVRNLEKKGIKLYAFSPVLVLPLLREALYMGLAATGAMDPEDSDDSVLKSVGKAGIRAALRRAIAAVCAAFAIGGGAAELSKQAAPAPEPTAAVQEYTEPEQEASAAQPEQEAPAAPTVSRSPVPEGAAADTLVVVGQEGSIPGNIHNTYRLPRLALGYGDDTAFNDWVAEGWRLIQLNLSYYDGSFRNTRVFEGDLRFDYSAEVYGNVLTVMLTVNGFPAAIDNCIVYDLTTGEKLTPQDLAAYAGVPWEYVDAQLMDAIQSRFDSEDAQHGQVRDADELRSQSIAERWEHVYMEVYPYCSGYPDCRGQITIRSDLCYTVRDTGDGPCTTYHPGGQSVSIRLPGFEVDPSISAPVHSVPADITADALVAVGEEGSVPGVIPNTYCLPRLMLDYGDDRAFRSFVNQYSDRLSRNLEYYNGYYRNQYNIEGDLQFGYTAEVMGKVLVVMFTVNGYPDEYSICYDLATGEELTFEALAEYAEVDMEYLDKLILDSIQERFDEEDFQFGEIRRTEELREETIRDRWGNTKLRIHPYLETCPYLYGDIMLNTEFCYVVRVNSDGAYADYTPGGQSVWTLVPSSAAYFHN